MLTIRLRRMGRKDRAFYRFVVSDSRKTPIASAVEEVGHYDPLQKPPVLQIQRDRIDYWVSNGATLSNTVKTLMRRAENGTMIEDKPKKAKAAKPEAAKPEESPKAEAAADEKADEKKAEEAKAEETKAEAKAEDAKPEEAQEAKAAKAEDSAKAEATDEKAQDDKAKDEAGEGSDSA